MVLFRKIILGLVVLIGMGFFVKAEVPSFDDNFANYLVDATPDKYGRTENVFKICIDRKKSLMENVRILFYPSTNYVNADSECSSRAGGIMWNLIRIVGFSILFVFILRTGLDFLYDSQESDKIKKAGQGLIYIGYGAFLFFGSVWLLGTVLDVENITGTSDLVSKVQGGPDSLFYMILSFFKAFAFFVAIVMIVYYGFKMMKAMDQEDKIKEARRGILNVIIALFLIKIIDYVFYIAQVPDFAAKATDFIVEIAKIVGYILGALFILYVFYAGFLLLTGSGDEDSFTKTKNIFMTIFLSGIVIFLFLLIIYQIFNEFAPGT